MKKRIFYSVFFLFLFVLSISIVAWGNSNEYLVSGRIVDKQGNLLEGVSIVFDSQTTSQSFNDITDENGIFEVEAPSDIYTVEINSELFINVSVQIYGVLGDYESLISDITVTCNHSYIAQQN